MCRNSAICSNCIIHIFSWWSPSDVVESNVVMCFNCTIHILYIWGGRLSYKMWSRCCHCLTLFLERRWCVSWCEICGGQTVHSAEEMFRKYLYQVSTPLGDKYCNHVTIWCGRFSDRILPLSDSWFFGKGNGSVGVKSVMFKQCRVYVQNLVINPVTM